MNKLILIGNLTKAPERFDHDGKTSVRFTLACSRRFNKDKTDFFDVWVRGALADLCMNYLNKGYKACAIGELQAGEYQKKDGTKGFSMNVSADEVFFLTPKNKDPKPDEFEDVNTPDLPWD